MWLTRALPADSRWHIVVFGGDIKDGDAAKRLQKLASDLEALVRAFTPSESDPDSLFNIILVLSSKRADVELGEIPEIFTPVADILKVFVDDEGYDGTHGHAYDAYGIEPSQGALIIIRPDQYISRIGPLNDVEGVESFFTGFLRKFNL
ncbi:hypothetical protein O1611_g3544 [Lasiodiplodia mahajangana]|uniref:Uncharacterized protein n=1 Tax=Lasiodiplodia mahajangana TaxID=1108764 RepID=A0ACC2JRF2_9PEZI|nr:hypothetical protein O1611_g3544 [Lasiodiplodia mahajangana]